MTYKFFIDDNVIKDLKKIDKKWQVKILDVIKTKLVKNPYAGKKLVGNLSEYYRYRVGNYRIIYEIIEEDIVVVILKIKHRKNIYRND
ncbi:type II toxin-antitoxin system mRNA interferase toxin, RelE/StbE family [Candidatus Halobeggiatoa sp. HSG11]|nr:type II toxin-antitoxin system mRNA interferase toxin, RelE/StbE family [Candidatus Halobeggiatoa sp. HSG11]